MKAKILRGAVIGSVVATFLIILFLFGLFGSWQNRLSDTLYTQHKAPNNIVIVAIDDKSIGEIGRFPWDREVYANFLNKLSLSKASPSVIGFDISFLENSNSKSDNDFANALKAFKNTKIVLATEKSGNEILEPIHIFRQNTFDGVVNTNPDGDGIVRKVPNISNSFGSQIAGVDSSGFINFIGKEGSFTTYSFSDVLNGRVDPKIFNGKTLLIGVTAPDIHDEEAVPTSAKMSGVEIQANIINSLLTQSEKQNEAKIITILTILLLSLGASIIFMYLPPIGVVIAMILVVIAYAIFVIFSFDAGVVRNIIYPLLVLVISAIANIIYKYLTESQAKKFLRQTFSYYLSEPVLNHLLENPEKIKLGGESKELTVMFSDIASFTSISEKLKPAELANLLNNYLTKMTNVIFENRGVLDKYIGDAIMAFWGAPQYEKDHAFLACKTAIEMQEEIKKNFDFTARVGINTGEMVVGNMGSNQRFDYSLLGDNVNLGSRLEGINKYYGTKICISENTYKKVESRVVARKLDIVAVKGKSKGVPIYELMKLGGVDKNIKTFLTEFEKARSLYEKGEFKESLSMFKEFLKNHKEDAPANMYVERIKELIDNPPKDWDGVYHATGK